MFAGIDFTCKDLQGHARLGASLQAEPTEPRHDVISPRREGEPGPA